MSDLSNSNLDALMGSSVAPGDTLAAPAGPTVGWTPETPPADASAPGGSVTLTEAQFEALLAAAKTPSSTPAQPAPVARITAATAAKVGDAVTHKGRLGTVIEVFTTERDINGEAWTQYLYRVGVFAENQLLDAEDVEEAN